MGWVEQAARSVIILGDGCIFILTPDFGPLMLSH